MSNIPKQMKKDSLRIHGEAIVIDGLDVSRFDAGHFRKMKEGGITAANATVAMPIVNFRQAIEAIRDFDTLISQNADLVRPIYSVEDITKSKKEKKVGLIFGLQNALPIEGDLRLIKVFYSLGIRVMQLTYMTANLIGDGCLEPRNGRLTIFGRAVVKELNQTGILIDLSHVGEKSTHEAIEVSDKPVAFTHACARAIVDHPRNKTDKAIRALAKKGGVMGITGYADFVCDYGHGEIPNLNHYLNQIDHVVNLVGIDHVGIGMDFEEGHPHDFLASPAWGGSRIMAGPRPVSVWPQPKAVADSSKFPQITEGLLSRGYTEGNIRKILGGNWLRLFSQVWKNSSAKPDVEPSRNE
jgi:membrane dipeptidase